MALEELRARIREQADRHRDVDCEHLARTIHVVLSPKFADLPDWCRRRYPAPFPGVEAAWPWLVAGPDGGLDAELGRALGVALALNTSTAAAEAGHAVLDHANQIVVICDLREERAIESVRGCVESCRVAVERAGLAVNEFFRIGVFIHGIGENANSAAEIAELGRMAEESFDRVFVLEHRNDGGVTIGDDEMLDLVGQLVAFLQRRPAERVHVAGERRYSDWLLSNSTTGGRITGFSAFSAVLPIEEVTEYIVRDHAVRILRDTLMAPADPERVHDHVDRVLTRCHLQSLDVACQHLDSETDIQVDGPLGRGDSPDAAFVRHDSEMFSDLRDGILLLREQEAVLDEYISERFAAMQPVLDGIQDEFAGSLDDEVTSSFSSDRGCVRIVCEALAGIESRLQSTLAEDPEEVTSTPPGPAIEQLVLAWNSGPDGLALALRAIVVMGMLVAMVFGIEGASLEVKLGLATGAAIVGVGALAYWNIWRSKIKSQMARCWSLLFDRKRAQERTSANTAVIGRRQFMLDAVRDIRQQADEVAQRVEWLLEAYGSHELPAEERWSTLWQRQGMGAAELERLSGTMSYDRPTIEAEVLTIDRPLSDWRTVFGDETAEIRQEEWAMLERVALRVVANAEPLLATSICSFLTDGSDRLDVLRNVLYETYRPFLKRAGGSMGVLRGRFEIPGSGCTDGVGEIPRAMESSFDSHEVVASGLYRISLMTFLEDVFFADLGVREEGGA